MHREKRKLGSTSKEPAGPSAATSGHVKQPSLIDEEFHEFFSKGDMGDYDGGLSFAQPLGKGVERPDDASPKPVSLELRARKAVLSRVVLGVVAGCVGLLVVAVQFRHGKTVSQAVPTERVMAATPVLEPKTPPTVGDRRAPEKLKSSPSAVSLLSQTDDLQVEPPPLPRAQSPAPNPEANAPRTAAAAPSISEKGDQTLESGAKTTPKVAADERSPVRNRGRRVAASRTSQAAQTALPDSKPTVSSGPAAAKQSVAAFPVD